jgi:ribosomal protein S18 acetylase RimI-like enzyme
MQRYDIHLLPTDRRFRLCDDADPTAGRSIDVEVDADGEISVTVVLHPQRPRLDAVGWRLVVDRPLRIDSGRVVVATATESYPEAFRIHLRAGLYQAVVCRGDTGWMVALFPAADAAGERPSAVSRLGAAHVTEYRELMLRAYAEAPDAFTSTPEERVREPESWWLKRIADRSGLKVAFGCFEDGALVGTVALEFSARPKTAHKAHVIGMFVAPEARGRGAARALMEAALAHCRAREEITSVVLTVTEGNEPALALYRAMGFEAFGIEPLAIRTDAGYRSKVHMQLSIPRGP